MELANLHGLTRTSKKQVDYLLELIKPFAGMSEFYGYSPTVWLSPEDKVELIDWRGIEPFGYERKWNELAYEEALGLAKFALEKDALDPVDVMCQEFNLKRRHETTLKQFNQWVMEYKETQQ